MEADTKYVAKKISRIGLITPIHLLTARKPLAAHQINREDLNLKKNSIGDLSMGYIHIALSSHEKEMLQKDEKTGRGRGDGRREKVVV
jgi:hypothetical protein